jgi:hypothetical protein
MAEIISCPSCQRKLQVPESLLGQDVQCPTCGATFVGAVGGAPPATRREPSPPPQEPGPQRRDDYGRRDYGDSDEDYRDDYGDDRRRRRPRRDLAPHRGSTILTLGILSLVVCGPIMGPIAWSMGHSDLQEMQAGRMDPEGEGITNAGKICGMIGTILSLVIIGFYCLIAVMAGTMGASRF